MRGSGDELMDSCSTFSK